jgi:hypothetical protein
MILSLNQWKGSGTTEGLLIREGVHLLGWDRMWGMRVYELGTIVGFGTKVVLC